MKRLGRAALLAVVLATGCYKATFIRDPGVQRGVERDEWVDFFIFGIVGEREFEVRQFCPDNRIAQIQTGGNFATGLVSALTIGIYTPRKIWVTCAANSRALRYELDEHGKLVAFAEAGR